MKTYTVKAGEIRRKWYIVDAQDLVLGRLASEVAQILRGKKNPTYTPHMDVGDNVIIVNSDKVKLTGNKLEQKIYYSHSGYPGGLREIPYSDLMKNKSDFVVTEGGTGHAPPTIASAGR